MTFLAKILAEFLKERDVDKIYVKRIKKRPFLQRLVVDILVKDLKLFKTEKYGRELSEEFGIKILTSKGQEKVNYEITTQGEKIEINYPKYPVFIIDLSLWDRHTEKEKKKLLLQLDFSLDVIRNYLWDYNLVINNPPKDVRLFEAINKVRYNVTPTENVVVLNPYGDIEANEELIRRTKYFIIGGIVDRSGWRNATTELSEIAGYSSFPQVKITLRGSTVGVPDRINKIIEIILRVLSGEKLEEAILNTQSNADKFVRLLMEYQKGNLEEAIEFLRPNEKVIRKINKIKEKFQSNSS